MKKSLAIAGALVLSALTVTAARAEYPERPIQMIVAYSAGGGTDIAARTLVPYIKKYLGNGATISVVNRSGAGGEIGFTALAQAKPDGYTIGFINTPNLLTNPIQRKTRYELKDIAPIANVIYDPGAFSVQPGQGIKDLKDLVAYAKDHPNEVTYGTTGLGSDDHLAALAFEKAAGVKLEHVPFSGNADVRTAILGGHIKMASMNISESIPNAKEGTLVVLGQMAEKRWDGAPDIPTFKEQGFDVIMGSDRGIGAPAGIPEEVMTKLQDAVKKAVADPEFVAAAKKQDLALSYQSASDFKAHLEALDASMRTLWKEQPWVQQ